MTTKKKYILALDQGTGSSRAILFDKSAEIKGLHQIEIEQFYPETNWVEQNPKEILNSQLDAVKTLLKQGNINPKDIAGIGITNQRETSILWNKTTGEPIYNAIIWQDQRTSNYCESIPENIKTQITNKTGLLVDPYFSATKIKWIIEHIPEAKKLIAKNELLFGTIDTWLIWNISEDHRHITDYSNASRTMLFNIHTLEWDETLLNYFEIPRSILPEVLDSSGQLARIKKEIFGESLNISGIAGDQQAALFGQAAFEKGMVKNTYGTGCFMLMNTGETVKVSKHKLLSTIAWRIDGKTSYALEGSVFIAGAAIKWLRDQLQLIKTAQETETLALSVHDNDGVYIVPAFSGLGAPYWNSKVNGMVKGLKLSTSKAHIVRATLESIAYRTKDVLNLMEIDSGIEIHALSVDGGASNNQFLMQFQSDILNIDVHIPKQQESTALGAAYLAGLANQFWTWEDLKQLKQSKKTYHPVMESTERDALYQEWQKAINQLIHEV